MVVRVGEVSVISVCLCVVYVFVCVYVCACVHLCMYLCMSPQSNCSSSNINVTIIDNTDGPFFDVKR